VRLQWRGRDRGITAWDGGFSKDSQTIDKLQGWEAERFLAKQHVFFVGVMRVLQMSTIPFFGLATCFRRTSGGADSGPGEPGVVGERNHVVFTVPSVSQIRLASVGQRRVYVQGRSCS